MKTMFSSKKVIRSASNSQLSSFLETLEEPEEIQEEEMEEEMTELPVFHSVSFYVWC